MSSLFPFTASAVERKENTTLPVFKELAYDFQNNRLLRNGGRTYLVEQDEALKIWIYKALKVKRFVWEAYTHDYGTELEEVIGSDNNTKVVESEIKRYITETLMVNPYIQELSDFHFVHEKSCVQVSFTVTTVYGRFSYESEVYNE